MKLLQLFGCSWYNDPRAAHPDPRQRGGLWPAPAGHAARPPPALVSLGAQAAAVPARRALPPASPSPGPWELSGEGESLLVRDRLCSLPLHPARASAEAG